MQHTVRFPCREDLKSRLFGGFASLPTAPLQRSAFLFDRWSPIRHATARMLFCVLSNVHLYIVVVFTCQSMPSSPEVQVEGNPCDTLLDVSV
jgi:hypothetical protein